MRRAYSERFPMKSFRITCRSLMIVVAFAALAIWCCVMWRRSAEFAAKAREHEFLIFIHKSNLYITLYDNFDNLIVPESPERAHFDKLIEKHNRMLEKYRRATVFPWLTVVPNPDALP